MRTRNGNYPSPSDGITFTIRPSVQKRRLSSATSSSSRGSERPTKLPKLTSRSPFDSLPDDLLISIIIAVSSTASSPSDLVNTMLTCRRFCAAATHSQVLANASISALAVEASSWSDGASRFLKQCADAGNIEACYTLGMIRFYCLQNKGGGASLMAKAAMASHSSALHSLAVIQFNGSGGSRKDKDLKAGVALCARAASLGHVDAMRELGHCLQDGYGVTQNIVKGRGLLLEANTREAAAAVAQSPRRFMEAALQITAGSGSGTMVCLHHHLHYYVQQRQQSLSLLNQQSAAPKTSTNQSNHKPALAEPLPSQQPQLRHGGEAGDSNNIADCHPVYTLLQGGGCSLLSDFGCNVPPAKLHVANRFMVDWFAMRPPASGLRLCSHSNCGRPETRRHEFRRCSACGKVNYCSRACQALDWKIRHKYDCTPADWGEGDREEENFLAGVVAGVDDAGGPGEGGGGDDDEEQES